MLATNRAERCGFGCLMAVAAALPVVSVWGLPRLHTFVVSQFEARRIPQQLQKPRVITLLRGLYQETFLEVEDGCGSFTDIIQVDVSPDVGEEIAFVDCEALRVTDATGRLLITTRLERPSYGFRQLVIPNADLRHALIVEEGQWHDPQLFDWHGRLLWRDERSKDYAGLAAQNIDRDDRMELLLWYFGHEGLLVLDDDGAVLWRTTTGEHIHRAAFLPPDDSGHVRIVYANGQNELAIRDLAGNLLHSSKPPVSCLCAFELTQWPPSAPSTRLLMVHKRDATGQNAQDSDHDAFTMLDPDGTIVAQLDAPEAAADGDNVRAHGTPVRLAADAELFFAVVCPYWHWRRTMLYLFDSSNRLVYQELLKGKYTSLEAVTLKPGHAQTLLVGGPGRVLKYALEE